MSFLTPDLAPLFSATIYQPRQMSMVTIGSVDALFADLETAIEKDDVSTAKDITDKMSKLEWLSLFPIPTEGLNLAVANGEWTGTVVVCHYSIVLFMAGKRVAGDNHDQINIQRPRALRSKIHYSEPLEMLEGSFRMSNHCHTAVNDAWSDMSSLKAVVFTEYSKYDSPDSDESQNIIWTTMHMLRFSGMSHAAILFNFLQTYPWAGDMPLLRASLSTYIRSVVAASKVEKRVLPYVKLIQGDKSGLFARKELEPLIACAVAALQEVQPTLAAYYTKPEFSAIVEAFLERREKYQERDDRQRGFDVKAKSVQTDFEAETESDEEEE